MISYVLTNVFGDQILDRCLARDQDHAITKFLARHGELPKESRIMSYQDYVQDRNLVLESMGKAPWQKKLDREERKMGYPLLNPAIPNEVLPPLYHLHSLHMTHGSNTGEHEPRFPVQICPSETNEVEFRFWGSANYDSHNAFGMMVDCSVQQVTYSILYRGDITRFSHNFRHAPVYLSLSGIISHRPIMKSFKSLDNMPELPYDWAYFQFVN